MFHIELIIEFLENVMNNIVQVAILFFEFVGVIVIILSGLKGFYNYVRRVPDMKITLAAGRAHVKHTEGGDFRQATYRAVRQGLMEAESILLEPWYDFRLELPAPQVGRAMTDLQQMGAQLSPPETAGEEAVLTGAVAVSALGDYAREVAAYTPGMKCPPGRTGPAAWTWDRRKRSRRGGLIPGAPLSTLGPSSRIRSSRPSSSGPTAP